ncbi:MAG: glycosyltransferase family 2 protein [Sandaracinaceae bacterium]|jgi:glycosyltransferase involved in cell wall biosynthesis|nr:glycosyltransferase family 2 protein [Sandaracinaceae bacterium]
MLQGKRVAVVVPAFNEARLIRRAVKGIPEFVDDIIVVDDASTDGTALTACSVQDERVRVIVHTENQGVGRAIASGYDHAFRKHADVVAVMAGDAQMDPHDLRTIVLPVIEGVAEYVKGDRLSWPGAREAMPFFRYVGNHLLSFFTRCVTGMRVRDSQCGFTAISRTAYTRVDMKSLWPRYGYPNDLLGRAAAARLVVCDVPVRPIYADERSGIGWRHALFVIPFVLARVVVRRVKSRKSASRTRPKASVALPAADASQS